MISMYMGCGSRGAKHGGEHLDARFAKAGDGFRALPAA